MRVKKTAQIDTKNCVACGCCEKVCPTGAVRVIKGIAAKVNTPKCVGCAKCITACPPSIIKIVKEHADETKKVD